MKKWNLLGAGFLALLVMILLPISLLPQQEKRPGERPAAIKPTSSLPAGLADFDPSRAKPPVFLFKMLELAHAFSGTVSDLAEDDGQNAQAQFDRCKAGYGEISGPAGEKDKAQKLALGIGRKSCHKCHQVHIPAAFAQKKK